MKAHLMGHWLFAQVVHVTAMGIPTGSELPVVD